MILNKAGMPEWKYMSHSAEDCTVMSTKRNIKDGIGGYMGSRDDTMKQHKKLKKMEERAEISQEAKQDAL